MLRWTSVAVVALTPASAASAYIAGEEQYPVLLRGSLHLHTSDSFQGIGYSGLPESLQEILGPADHSRCPSPAELIAWARDQAKRDFVGLSGHAEAPSQQDRRDQGLLADGAAGIPALRGFEWTVSGSGRINVSNTETHAPSGGRKGMGGAKKRVKFLLEVAHENPGLEPKGGRA